MKRLLPYLIITLSLSACTTGELLDVLPDNRPDYKTSKTINPLEIPPDLTHSSIDDGLNVAELSATDNARLSTYQNERKSNGQSDHLATSLKNIQSNGDVSWIEIDAPPAKVFHNVKRFWLNNGLVLARVDEGIGIIETDWLQKKANLPTSGISAMLSKLVSGLKDDSVRDKFRTRVDYDGKRSYVYLTHYGATEKQIDRYGKVIRHGGGKKSGHRDYAWIANDRNPELEVEMLRRLNLYLHKMGKQAAVAPSAQTKQQASMRFTQLADGTPALVIEGSFNQAWMMLGVAIDRAGFDLSKQNRRGGTYTFVKVTERDVGFILSKIERDIDTYQIGMADRGNQQVAVVRSINGKSPSAAESKAILQKISKEIRF